MTLLDKINYLCDKKKISRRTMEQEINISLGSSSRWNKSSPSIDIIKKVAAYFDVSIDYLVNDKDLDSSKLAFFTDNHDIAKDLDRIMYEIQNGENNPLYYNGIEISPASKSLLENAIAFALRETNIENKVKYNPYKNKSR